MLREGDEYGTIYNDDDHFYINAADVSGDLYLGNNTSATAITVENGTGDVGIGISTPAYLLDVNGGDINLTNDANFYRIQGREALYFDAVHNLMVGTSHGLTALDTGIRNIFVGNQAGVALTGGEFNSVLGHWSGTNITTAIHSSFFGYESGRNVTTGEFNSFYGSQSGRILTTGDRNTILGYCAGGALTTGDRNVFIGHQAGSDLGASEDNDFNVIIGAFAGINTPTVMTDAQALTLLGYNTEAANGLNNAGAIGCNASVTDDNCLVLGSIGGVNNAPTGAHTNVGIGTTAPANRLEIVRGTAGSNISGLRLWSLVGSTPAAPSNGVLSIDGNGDVILVEDACTTLVLKAEDSDAYFRITVNAKGEIKATQI